MKIGLNGMYITKYINLVNKDYGIHNAQVLHDNDETLYAAW